MQKSVFFIAFLLIFCNNRLVAQAIHFQEFSINDTLITEKNKILEINGQSVNILISHFPNDTTHYQYQLEGIDKEWKNYQIQSNIYYHELPGGKYTFIIRTKNNTTQQQKVFVNIRPQLWQKWWFLPSIYLFIVLIIASALYFVFLYRLRQEVQMRQVRNNIASDLHDEIGATLSGIGILSTIAQQKLLESHPSYALIGRITEDALNIGNTMDDIVWSINPKNDDLENIIARLSRHAAELFDAKEIDYQIVMPENLKDIKLTMEQRRDVYLIFKEAVNNLIKYAKCQHATIKIQVNKQQFELLLSDDGIGFDINKNSNRNGIKNMKTRANNLNGNLHIESALGKGTTVKLSFVI